SPIHFGPTAILPRDLCGGRGSMAVGPKCMGLSRGPFNWPCFPKVGVHRVVGPWTLPEVRWPPGSRAAALVHGELPVHATVLVHGALLVHDPSLVHGATWVRV